MKNFFLSCFILCVTSQTNAQVNIWSNNKVIYTAAISNIDSITFGKAPTPALPEGMLPGLFSIGDGIYAHFSKGNLIYSNENGKIWSFAEQQYQYGSDFGWGGKWLQWCFSIVVN